MASLQANGVEISFRLPSTFAGSLLSVAVDFFTDNSEGNIIPVLGIDFVYVDRAHA